MHFYKRFVSTAVSHQSYLSMSCEVVMYLIYNVNYKQYAMTNNAILSESGYDCRTRAHYSLSTTNMATIWHKTAG